MDFNLTGKVAIVTGGASGIGAAISETLAAEGAYVLVNYRGREKQAIDLCNRFANQYHTKALPVYGDISKAVDIENIISETIKAFGKIDILVNNAGVWPTSFVLDMSDEEWESTVKTNLTGTFLFCKRFIHHLVDRQSGGKIVNMVSQAAFRGSTTGHAHYAAAKGGVVAFTISLAREVAKLGINVNAVAPGMARTPMNEKELGEREDEYLARIPLGRIADPMEVAYAVAFLVSDKANYITGATLDVTGGMLMR
jgi:3-oxoacyl-[acyl-carrier protein] reductase